MMRGKGNDNSGYRLRLPVFGPFHYWFSGNSYWFGGVYSNTKWLSASQLHKCMLFNFFRCLFHAPYCMTKLVASMTLF